MLVFNNKHSFAQWCASQLLQHEVLSGMFKKAFRKAKESKELLGEKFIYDDFVIDYFLFYSSLGKPKCD